jgi:diadenosine tetraphosphatase ApaH/serine/threonine PP2A family protein phosphatase
MDSSDGKGLSPQVRYLILSDLHSNQEALDAVVREAQGRWDTAICCGDLVGYGADPNSVADWVRANCALVVRGNHDRACTGIEDLEWFNPVAQSAALWTERELTPPNLEWVRGLSKGPLVLEQFEVAHGSPYDEDEYVMAGEEAAAAFYYLQRRLAFFGHTHMQGGYIWNRARVETIPRMPARARSRTIHIDSDCAYLVNPGSVGQPRDGDPRAAFALYDSAANTVTYRRAAYDVAAAQRKIRQAGLPPILAERLAVGR